MTKYAVKRAAEEHTDLSVFSAIISILEGGSLYGHGREVRKSLISANVRRVAVFTHTINMLQKLARRTKKYEQNSLR